MRSNYKLIAGAGLLCVLIQFSCGQQPRKISNLPGYDLSKPQKFDMPPELMEVSGIAFDGGNPARVYAEQDEEGSVFYLKPGDKTAHATQFGKAGDYEDISIINGRVYMLKSNGTIYSFALSELTKPEATGVMEYKDLVPKSEYEGLYGDAKTGKLYVLVKNEAGAKQTKSGNGFVLQATGDKLTASGQFSIDVKEIARLAGKKKLDFKPSALAQHPITGEWYIVSAVNKALVVCAANWQVKAVYPLGGDFLQPEGIAFDKAANLYISNEGDELSPGNILKFSRVQK